MTIRTTLRRILIVWAFCLSTLSTTAWAQDADGDGVPDASDNCLEVPNAGSMSCDTDGDGYGNACDGDFDQNGVTNAVDFIGPFLQDFGSGVDLGIGTDMDCNGIVNAVDFLDFFLVNFTAGAPGPGSDPGSSSGEGLLDGPDGDLASAWIPDLAFPAPDPAHFADIDGIPYSRRTFLVVVAPTSTVADINGILTSFEASIIGGIPGADLLLLLLPDIPVETTAEVFEALQADSHLDGAVMDVGGLENQRMTPVNVEPGRWDWDPLAAPEDGNWGHEIIRAPQLWNFDDAVQKYATHDEVCVGILEAVGTAQTDHEDLLTHPTKDKLFDPGTPNGSDDHATMVSGIIGATWDNNLGIEGVNPWLEKGDVFNRSGVLATSKGKLSGQANILLRLMAATPCIKVVNVSSGWNGNAPDVLVVDAAGRVLNNALEAMLAHEGRSDLMVVASAGNDGPTVPARRNSPAANAAIQFDGSRFAAVEHIQPGAAADPSAQLGGTVSAPGTCVTSTEADNGVDADAPIAKCPWSDAGTSPLYSTRSGSSFAAAYVTGLVAALWKLQPGLTFSEIQSLLSDPMYTRSTTGGTKGHIDAFAAAIGIDLVFEHDGNTMQGSMLDVDDGTPDGNLRRRAFPEDPDPDTFHNTNKVRGDGLIDMSDFRVFRDAWLDASDVLMEVALDGDASHFKRDLNMDGCVVVDKLFELDDFLAVAPGHPARIPTPTAEQCSASLPEHLHSRFDFNGNGVLPTEAASLVPPASAVAPFKTDPDTKCTGLDTPADCLRDIDVLLGLLSSGEANVGNAGLSGDPPCGPGPFSIPPPAGWSATSVGDDLEGDGIHDYMRSADLHIRSGDADSDSGLVVRSGNTDLKYFRKCRHDPWDGVITVPVYDETPDSRLQVDYKQTKAHETRGLKLIGVPLPGEDFGLEVKFSKLDFESTLPTRLKLASVFPRTEQLESLTRDSDHPEGPYATAIAGTEEDLESVMYDLAETHIVPKSLVKAWLGKAEVVVPTYTSSCVAVNDDGDCVALYGELMGALMMGVD